MLHRSRAGLLLSLSSTLALVACNGDGGTSGSGSGAGTASGLPCDVDKILVDHCQQCHGATPSFGAPMPLVTHADLVAPAKTDATKKVYELVAKRTHDTAAPMPQPPNAPLDAASQKILDDWITAGAPSSSDKCNNGGGTGGGVPSCTPDTKLHPTASYTMPADANDMYICYGVDVTVSAKRHITSFIPYIENSKIVHHIVLFQSDASAPPGPVPCSFGGSMSRIVAVWAPGNPGFSLPQEAGLPLEGTAHYVLQVHYNNIQHLSGETDASGFDLCTTDELRPNDADVLAFGTENFNVPAHGSLDVSCDFQVPEGSGSYHVIGAMPHMHKLGTVIETKNIPGGTGAPVDIGSRDPWNFDTQYWTPLDQVVQAGDTVRTRCAWTNPSDQAVHFGENTEDEMCFTFELYYPKIESPNWNWSIPSFISKCSPTP
ncbi:MAG: peptidylglycine alpha-amidating monooxygenase [Minicystis sp.]